MNAKFSKKRAISTVLTTIIILVASVVLGSGVVLYGTSLFQGGTQTESISVQGVKMWVNPDDDTAWGAFAIRNSGDKIVSVDKIQVRGTDVPFTRWFTDVDQTRVTTGNFQSAMNYTTNYANGTLKGSANSGGAVNPPATCTANIIIDLDGAGTEPAVCLDARTGPMGLSPGQRAILYFHLQDGIITSIDSGALTSVNVFAGKAGAPQSITVANP